MSQIETSYKPKQERSRQARESILLATLELLEVSGLEKISTNQIAKAAEVNIATLYKHFSDKYQILSELARNFSKKQSDLICTYLVNTPTSSSIKIVCDGLVDALTEGTKDDRALVQLQRALIVFPELHEIYRRSNIEIGVAMKPFLCAWGINLNPQQLNVSMTCIGEAFGALQDLALSDSSTYNDEVINELKLLLTGYYQSRSKPSNS